MAATAIRKKLITFLADADEKKVRAIYALFEDDIKREEGFKLQEEHLKILDERMARHLDGKDKSSGWEEAHARIKTKRK